MPVENGWNYTNADRQLAKRFILELKGELIPGCSGRYKENRRIEFQFPPKVTSDNRKGEWVEAEVQGEEKVAGFKRTGGREMTISWTYVVDSNEEGKDRWTIDRISANVRAIRGYFMQIKKIKEDIDIMSVRCRFWCLGGKEYMTGRIRSVDVKYGETMVLKPGGLSGLAAGDSAYPLRTDVTVDFALWTQGLSDNVVLENVRSLAERIVPSWY